MHNEVILLVSEEESGVMLLLCEEESEVMLLLCEKESEVMMLMYDEESEVMLLVCEEEMWGVTSAPSPASEPAEGQSGSWLGLVTSN